MQERSIGPPAMANRLRLCAVALVSLSATSCIFGGTPGFKLGVPFAKQEQFNYCTAASVQMRSLFAHHSSASQTVIFNWEGGTGCTTILRTAQAVAYFAGVDATWDRDSDANYYQMISRQVASVSNGQPVIPVVRFNHTGVIDGGLWEQPGSFYVWDFVYFHDPDYNVGGPDLYIGATDWIQNFCPSGAVFCDQVVSGSAIAGWEQDLSTYGPYVRVQGGGRGGPYAM